MDQSRNPSISDQVLSQISNHRIMANILFLPSAEIWLQGVENPVSESKSNRPGPRPYQITNI
jgi:hypothetical protein